MSDWDSYLNSCSENFLVRWDSTGMPKEIEKLNNLPALFTVTESSGAEQKDGRLRLLLPLPSERFNTFAP